MIWIDGERRGNFKLSRSYLMRAKEKSSTRAKPDYAFYYASGIKETDHNNIKNYAFAVGP